MFNMILRNSIQYFLKEQYLICLCDGDPF